MNSTLLTLHQQAQLALLRAHFSRPGALSGTDLLSGKKYESFYPLNVDDFFTSHLLGPGRRRQGSHVIAQDAGEQMHQLHSFYRPEVLPLDDNGSTSTISLTITGQAGLEPTRELCSIVDHLRAFGWPVIIERSFRLLRWTLWTFLDKPVQEVTARDLAYSQYCAIRDQNMVDRELLEVPLVDKNADLPYLMFQFFSGEFFGSLHDLQEGRLRLLDMEAVPHFDPISEMTVLRSLAGGMKAQTFDALFTAWWQHFKNRRIRAGDLLSALDNAGVSIDSVVSPGDLHRRTIELGLALRGLRNAVVGRWKVCARQSGHGTAFWLVEADGSAH